MANLTSVLKYLQQERNRLGSQLERLNHALSVLIGTSNHRARRTISAAGRARIAAAQRARWAKSKGHKVVSILARKGRKMSPAARKRIVAAQKARWAKWRKAHKKG
jgi:predicted RNA-binding protein with PIN domain